MKSERADVAAEVFGDERAEPQRDPEQLLKNAYRVLLTRGRDGVVAWVPADSDLNATAHALLAAGMRTLRLDEQATSGRAVAL